MSYINKLINDSNELYVNQKFWDLKQDIKDSLIPLKKFFKLRNELRTMNCVNLTHEEQIKRDDLSLSLERETQKCMQSINHLENI